jgi:hypothetical protein
VRKSRDFSQRINKKSEELSLTHIEKEVTHQPNHINVRNIFIIICYVMFTGLLVCCFGILFWLYVWLSELLGLHNKFFMMSRPI